VAPLRYLFPVRAPASIPETEFSSEDFWLKAMESLRIT
jgi:hypothetical protein